MLRSFELRIRPTSPQRHAFLDILRDSRETYNAALQERKEAWKTQGEAMSETCTTCRGTGTVHEAIPRLYGSNPAFREVACAECRERIAFLRGARARTEQIIKATAGHFLTGAREEIIRALPDPEYTEEGQ